MRGAWHEGAWHEGAGHEGAGYEGGNAAGCWWELSRARVRVAAGAWRLGPMRTHAGGHPEQAPPLAHLVRPRAQHPGLLGAPPPPRLPPHRGAPRPTPPTPPTPPTSSAPRSSICARRASRMRE